METISGYEASNLIKAIVKQINRGNLSQLMRLADYLDLTTATSTHGKVIRKSQALLCGRSKIPFLLNLITNSSLSFPASDLQCIEKEEEGGVNCFINFGGLCGVDSVLPNYLNQLALNDDLQGKAWRKLMSMFSHRLYCLTYLSWKKHHVIDAYRTTQSNFMQFLMALSGKSLQERDQTEFALASFFIYPTRSATALKNLLQGYLDGIPVSIKQFIPNWVKMNERKRLQQMEPPRLGVSAYLGGEVIDTSSKIEISLGPFHFQQAQQFFPAKPFCKNLHRLLKRFIDPIIDYSLRLKIINLAEEKWRLGQPYHLGWTTLLGNSNQELILSFNQNIIIANFGH